MYYYNSITQKSQTISYLIIKINEQNKPFFKSANNNIKNLWQTLMLTPDKEVFL